MKIAVIGCGYWGPNLIRNFSQLNKVDKLYCCDLDCKRLDRVTNLFPLVKGVRDHKELLEMPEPSFISPTDQETPTVRELRNMNRSGNNAILSWDA